MGKGLVRDWRGSGGEETNINSNSKNKNGTAETRNSTCPPPAGCGRSETRSAAHRPWFPYAR